MNKKEWKVFKTIEEKGPIEHQNLANEVGLEWYQLQEIIRDLRNEGGVVNTLSRRYDVNE